MKPRLFIDTNIILDLLGEREKFYLPAAQLASLADKGVVIMVVSPISFATVNYFLSKYSSPENAKDKLRKFKVICEITALDVNIIEKGLSSAFKDFEDSLQYFSAVTAECDIIISRNAKDFKNSSLPVMTAEEYMKSLRS